MKIGIMQPYFIPYIGYWQLINLVDKYVIYDDVNFIKGGWINRNRILVNGDIKYFNIPMSGASPYKKINEINVNNDNRLVGKNIRVIEGAYKKAPFYEEVFPMVEQILRCGKNNISEYIEYSFHIIAGYLGITTEFIISSSLDKNCSLKGQDKVLDICQLLGATEYYNAIGGQELYSFDVFKKNGIILKFLETDEIKYKQFSSVFYSNLSIIDVMMFNPRETVQGMLDNYKIIEG